MLDRMLRHAMAFGIAEMSAAHEAADIGPSDQPLKLNKDRLIGSSGTWTRYSAV